MPLLQDVDARLTLTRAATAPVLVAEIAKSYNQRLEVSPTMRTEILMVSVENARVVDVLTKLAVAATASWQPIEGGYRLVPDKAERAIEASAERARRLLAIQKGIEQRAAEAKESGEETAAMMGAFAGGMMGSHSVDGFLPMIDLNAIASLRPGERVVFATAPTPMQRPLKGDPSRLLQGMIAAHNQQAKEIAAHMSEMPPEVEAFMKGPIGDRFRKMSRPIVGAPAKVIVTASRGGNLMSFLGGGGLDLRVEVRAYGADGSVMLEESGALDANVRSVLMSFGKEKPSAPPANGKTTPIEYSEDAKEILSMGVKIGSSDVMGGGFGRVSKLKPEVRARILRPDEYEPLGLFPGEGLTALAKARRKPIVAELPDAAFISMFGTAPKTVEEVEADLKEGSMRLVPDNEWVVVRPADPDTARSSRVDRAGLRNLLAAVADHGTPTLDDMAAYAMTSPSPLSDTVGLFFISTFLPSEMSSMNGLISWDTLRLYGSLSPSQRQTIADGGSISFGNVGATGQAALRSLLYGSEGSVNVEREGQPEGNDPISMGMRMAMGGGGVDARDEPTQVAPNGLPMDGVLRGGRTGEPAFQLLGDTGGNATVGVSELALFSLLKDAQLPGNGGSGMRLPEEAAVGSRTVWTLHGYIAPGVWVGGTLNDDRVDAKAEKYSLTGLPPELQTRVAQEADKLKKGPFGAILGMMGSHKDPAIAP